MKQFIKGLLVMTLLVTGSMAKEESKTATVAVQDIQIFTSANADGKITPKTIEAALVKVGLFVSENRDMNFPFKIQFKETSYDTYNLCTFYDKETTLALVKEYPQIGMFAPLSMSIYTRKGDKKISISTLTPAAISKILKNPCRQYCFGENGQDAQGCTESCNA